MRLYYGTKTPPKADDLDLDMFDDRTLSSLVGSAHAPLPDGMDNDNPYRVLPLERWRDRS